MSCNECNDEAKGMMMIRPHKYANVSTSDESPSPTAVANLLKSPVSPTLINCVTNKVLLKELGQSWKYTMMKSKTYLKLNKNNENSDVDKIQKFKRGNNVRLIKHLECVGTIKYIKEYEDGTFTYGVSFKCNTKYIRRYHGYELQFIPRRQYREESEDFTLPPVDYKKHLYLNLVTHNKLGKKLINYIDCNGNNNSDDDHTYELIERLDASIERYHRGMVSKHSTIVNQIMHRLNPYLKQETKTDKSGRVRICLQQREEEEEKDHNNENDEKQQCQEPNKINSNNTRLWQFMNDILGLINVTNTKCKFNIEKGIYLPIYYVLRYFCFQSLKGNGKHGDIFDSRDCDSDRIIAAWILYKFKTCLNGKYKQFIDKYETNFKETTAQIDKWCQQNGYNISNQFEENEKIVSETQTAANRESEKRLELMRQEFAAKLYNIGGSHH